MAQPKAYRAQGNKNDMTRAVYRIPMKVKLRILNALKPVVSGFRPRCYSIAFLWKDTLPYVRDVHFSEIVLDSSFHRMHASLQNLLALDPGLPALTRELYLIDFHSRSSSAVAAFPALPAAFARMRNLRSLELTGWHLPTMPNYDTIRDAISRMSSITHFSLLETHVDVLQLVDLLEAVPHIKSLQLQAGSHIAGLMEDLPYDPKPLLELDKLVVHLFGDQNCDLCDWLSDQSKKSPLITARTLDLYSFSPRSPRSMESLNQLLEATKASHLHIDNVVGEMDRSGDRPPAVYSIPAINVRNLTKFSCRMQLSPSVFRSGLTLNIFRDAEAQLGGSRLREVEFRVTPGPQEGTYSHDRPNKTYKRLDNALVALKLDKFSVIPDYPASSSELREIMDDVFPRYFPRARKHYELETQSPPQIRALHRVPFELKLEILGHMGSDVKGWREDYFPLAFVWKDTLPIVRKAQFSVIVLDTEFFRANRANAALDNLLQLDPERLKHTKELFLIDFKSSLVGHPLLADLIKRMCNLEALEMTGWKLARISNFSSIWESVATLSRLSSLTFLETQIDIPRLFALLSVVPQIKTLTLQADSDEGVDRHSSAPLRPFLTLDKLRINLIAGNDFELCNLLSDRASSLTPLKLVRSIELAVIFPRNRKMVGVLNKLLESTQASHLHVETVMGELETHGEMSPPIYDLPQLSLKHLTTFSCRMQLSPNTLRPALSLNVFRDVQGSRLKGVEFFVSPGPQEDTYLAGKPHESYDMLDRALVALNLKSFTFVANYPITDAERFALVKEIVPRYFPKAVRKYGSQYTTYV